MVFVYLSAILKDCLLEAPPRPVTKSCILYLWVLIAQGPGHLLGGRLTQQGVGHAGVLDALGQGEIVLCLVTHTIRMVTPGPEWWGLYWLCWELAN